VAGSLRTLDAKLEVRAVDSDRTFTGYGSVFGVLDSYSDIVAKGAFRRTLQERKGRIAMLWQHDPTEPIGVWEELREDSAGLFVKGRLADTPEGNKAYRLLKMGALSGLSIGFRTVKSEFDDARGVRTLTDIELHEISVVTFPANSSATVVEVRRQQPMSPMEELLASAEWYLETAKETRRALDRSSLATDLNRITALLTAHNAIQQQRVDQLRHRVNRLASKAGL
jgi:HK97 family phage prohead protease